MSQTAKLINSQRVDLTRSFVHPTWTGSWLFDQWCVRKCLVVSLLRLVTFRVGQKQLGQRAIVEKQPRTKPRRVGFLMFLIDGGSTGHHFRWDLRFYEITCNLRNIVHIICSNIGNPMGFPTYVLIKSNKYVIHMQPMVLVY